MNGRNWVEVLMGIAVQAVVAALVVGTLIGAALAGLVALVWWGIGGAQ